jgi:hypothetical protein
MIFNSSEFFSFFLQKRGIFLEKDVFKLKKPQGNISLGPDN